MLLPLLGERAVPACASSTLAQGTRLLAHRAAHYCEEEGVSLCPLPPRQHGLLTAPTTHENRRQPWDIKAKVPVGQHNRCCGLTSRTPFSTFPAKQFKFFTFKYLELILWEQGKKGEKAWTDQKKNVLFCSVWNISSLNKNPGSISKLYVCFKPINEITVIFHPLSQNWLQTSPRSNI